MTLIVNRSGVCKTCRRPYKDRLWGKEEFLKQNKVLIQKYGEEKLWESHQAWIKECHPGMIPCPLNCEYVVEFAD
jgi:hypothetical protein